MKQAIGGAWLLGIVMVFMVVFIAYVAITINYNHAFKLKSDMIQIVEEYEGINSQSVEMLQKRMNASSYTAQGPCKDDPKYVNIVGVNGTDVKVRGKSPSYTPLTGKYNYCIYIENINNRYYYNLEVFLKFNLPVLGDIFDFRVIGETNPILYPNDYASIVK